jgi:DNA-nicking Smr family endonuclease
VAAAAAALMSSRGRRGPSEEDRALWARVTRSVTPLRNPSAPAAAAGRSAPPAPHKPPAKTSARTAALTHAASKPAPAPAPLAPIDRRLKARLKRGTQAIDARIDLHGMTQSEAHAALSRFLRRAQRDGARFALVITGKGVRGDGTDRERGVLRRQVPLWLRLPEFRPYVIGFEAAHVGHGGEGALYLRIRKSGDR